MELGYRVGIVSQTVLVVERKEGGFERGSQILWGIAEGVSGAGTQPCSWAGSFKRREPAQP